jgi:serine phosphatase RsbU (regulator of sigma subunit)
VSEIEEVLLEGVPLGTLPDQAHSIREIPIEPDTVILAMSDGILEAADPVGEVFGYERVKQRLRDAESEPPRAVLDRLVDSVNSFTGSSNLGDDVTLVLLRVGWR